MNLLYKDDRLFVFRNVDVMQKALTENNMTVAFADFIFEDTGKSYVLVKDRVGIFAFEMYNKKLVLDIIKMTYEREYN